MRTNTPRINTDPRPRRDRGRSRRRGRGFAHRLACLGAVLALLAPLAEAKAQAGDDPERVQLIVPQRPPHTGGVAVRGIDADILLDGELVRTTLSIRLHNPSPRPARCELLVPVPGAAAITGFALEGLPGDPPSKLLPRDEARRIFEEIVRTMQDPGLLEFAGAGLIRSSVFPVPAHAEQVFRVTYEHLAPGEGAQREITLPRGALTDSGPAWTVRAHIRGSPPVLSVISPTHPIRVTIHPDGSAEVIAESLSQAGPFRLITLRHGGEGPAASVLAYPDPESPDGGYFMLTLAAPARSPGGGAIPREVTIVLDRSGSMQGGKFDQARRAALQVVRALGEDERFNIIDYADTVSSFAPVPVAPGWRWAFESERLLLMDESSGVPTAVEKAESYLNALRPVGGTNIHEALLAALRHEPSEGTLPIILFLTDGLPTVGVRAEKDIREKILAANGGTRRIFTFGVGHDVNVPLLTDLARESRGLPEFVAPGEDVEAAVGRIFARLSGPVLTDLQLGATHAAGCGFEPVTDLFPRTPGDLYEHQRLVVLGRYRACPGGLTLSVRGESGEGPVVRAVTIDHALASPGHSHIARLWAQQKVTWLIDELRSAGGDPRVRGLDSLREDPALKELVDEIIRLSVRHGILTEYTAFLAVEEQMRGRLDDVAKVWEATIAPDAIGQRTGVGGVALGQAQRARRDQIDAGRAIALDEQISAGEQIAGGAGGGPMPFASAPALREDLSRARMTIRQVGPDTLYQQRGRWVDARLVARDQQRATGETIPPPDEVVPFGTDRYFEIARALAAEDRQGVITVRGEVEILLGGRRILVQNPA